MDGFEKFYNKALRFLSYRPRSEKEVRDNLNKKFRHSKRAFTKQGEDDSLKVIDRVIEKLRKQKFLNDEDFAKWWIEQRTCFKLRSMRIIKIELKQKGIAGEIIESGIRNYELGGKMDLQQAKKLVQKRIPRYKNLPKQEIYQKLGRFLASKGFDWDTIKRSIDSILSSVD